jgi:hypothetical protein
MLFFWAQKVVVPRASGSAKKPLTDQWLFNLVCPPKLEPESKGSWAVLRDEIHDESIG